MAIECKIKTDAINKIIRDQLPTLLGDNVINKSQFDSLNQKVTQMDTKVNQMQTKVDKIPNATLIYSSNSITCSNSEPSSSLPNGHIHMKY